MEDILQKMEAELPGAGGTGCELIEGHMLSGAPAGGQWRKLCFMLGTLLGDHLAANDLDDEVMPGPLMVRLGDCSLLRCELVTAKKQPEPEQPGPEEEESEHSAVRFLPLRFVANSLTDKNALDDCMDKTQIYSDAGVLEYWLIDVGRQFVYAFSLQGQTEFRRYSFEQTIRSSAYPGFSCCLSEMMWEEGGCLKELAVFYRFRNELDERNAIAEEPADYDSGEEDVYSAGTFYRWMDTRRCLPHMSSMTELLLGGIRENAKPSARHSRIQGNLYFYIRGWLHEKKSGWQLCFSPMAVELTGEGILDCVLRPDIFLVPRDADIVDNIYRGVPAWVIEIADPASAAADYIDKEQVYTYHGVKEYWIINDWKKQVMVLRAGQIRPRIFSYKESIEPVCLPGLHISMDEVSVLW